MKPRRAFGLGMVLVAVLLAPFLPWNTWKEQISALRAPTVAVPPPVTATSTEELFEGDRTRPYQLALREQDSPNPFSWQLLVTDGVTGYAYQGERAYSVLGTVVTSTDEVAFAAYDSQGEVVAQATTTWRGASFTARMTYFGRREARPLRLLTDTAETVRLSFEQTEGEWEDQARSMGCAFRMMFPTVEAGGPVSRVAADAMNRSIRARLLNGKSTAEQAKNTFLRECRTELEAEREQLVAYGDTGGTHFQRSWFVDASIARARSPWLSVTFDVHTYSGGAHGMTGVESFLFDVRTGRELELKELLRDEAALASFHGVVAAKLLEEYRDGLFDEQASAFQAYVSDRSRQLERWRAGELGYATNTTFMVTPVGVRVIFQPYEVAPYAVGMPTVDLPFSQWASLASEEARRVWNTR